MRKQALFRQVVIVGVGLLGASFAQACRQKKMARKIIGLGRNNLSEALKRKIIDEGQTPDFLKTLGSEDLVVLATPVSTIFSFLEKIPRTPLVIDVGSTKQTLVKEADKRKLRFIGCHPIAGSEKSGVCFARPDLFDGRLCLLTPSSKTDKSDLALVKKLWEKLGARVELLTPEIHDHVFAYTSHLPQLVASLLVTTFGTGLRLRDRKKFVFSGFRDTTRIAASSAEMWRDICLENRGPLLEAVEKFAQHLEKISSMIKKNDGKKLVRFFEEAKRLRQMLDPRP